MSALKIKFLNVPLSKDELKGNPIQFGKGGDTHVAVCSAMTLAFYEQAFRSDPASQHHALVDDVSSGGGVMGVNVTAVMRAVWAMLVVADKGGLNDKVSPVETDFDEFMAAHITDMVDLYQLNYLVSKEVDASFPSLAALLEKSGADE